jgi:hypothetical protein
VGFAAAALGAAANAAIFALSIALGIFPSLTFQLDLGAQMSIEPVLLVSAVGALAGIGVFALLRPRVAEPVGVFVRISVAVLLVSFVAPFVIPGMTMLQAVVLNLLHVVIAAAVVGAVLRTAAP